MMLMIAAAKLMTVMKMLGLFCGKLKALLMVEDGDEHCDEEMRTTGGIDDDFDSKWNPGSLLWEAQSTRLDAFSSFCCRTSLNFGHDDDDEEEEDGEDGVDCDGREL